MTTECPPTRRRGRGRASGFHMTRQRYTRLSDAGCQAHSGDVNTRGTIICCAWAAAAFLLELFLGSYGPVN
jgi:hypothetical protein